MRLLRRNPGIAYPETAMVEDPLSGNRIELLLDRSCTCSLLEHIAYEVDNVDVVFGRLRGEGFTVDREPFDVPGTTVRTSFLRTPEGLKIELIHYGVKHEKGKA